MDLTIVVILLVIISLVILFSSNFIRKLRYKEAFAWGRIEHAAGRLLGVALIFTCIFAYFRASLFYLALVDMLLWIIYFIAHNLEKWFYPKPRKD